MSPDTQKEGAKLPGNRAKAYELTFSKAPTDPKYAYALRPKERCAKGAVGDISDGWFLVAGFPPLASEMVPLSVLDPKSDLLQDRYHFFPDRDSAEALAKAIPAGRLVWAFVLPVQVIPELKRICAPPVASGYRYKSALWETTDRWVRLLLADVSAYEAFIKGHVEAQQSGAKGEFLKNLVFRRNETFKQLRERLREWDRLPVDRWKVLLNPLVNPLTKLHNTLFDPTWGSNAREKKVEHHLSVLVQTKNLIALAGEIVAGLPEAKKIPVAPPAPTKPPHPGDITAPRHEKIRKGALGLIDRNERSLLGARKALADCECSSASRRRMLAGPLRAKGRAHERLVEELASAARGLGWSTSSHLEKALAASARVGEDLVDFWEYLAEEPGEVLFNGGYSLIRRAIAAGISAENKILGVSSPSGAAAAGS